MFSSVQHTTLKHGHSFVELDEVFHHMQKVYRRTEIIRKPRNYHKIYERQGKVKLFVKTWRILEKVWFRVFEHNISFSVKTKGVLHIGLYSYKSVNTFFFVKNNTQLWDGFGLYGSKKERKMNVEVSSSGMDAVLLCTYLPSFRTIVLPSSS